MSLKLVSSRLWRLGAKDKAGFNMQWPSIIAERERDTEEKEKGERGGIDVDKPCDLNESE